MNWKEQSEEFWRSRLTPEQFRILRKKATEHPFSGGHCESHEPGLYGCAGCGQELFSADKKYNSGTGWPSFNSPVSPEAVELEEDRSHGMVRMEVRCSRCGGHLGHVFEDGPEPTGLRYCINSADLMRFNSRR